MASSDLTITDVFPMRKRRALRLGTTAQSKNQDNTNWEQKKPDTSLLKTPISKLSSRKPGKSPVGRNDKQQPSCTPTRSNHSPSIALGRLRRTPQRLAAWRHLSPCDSGPEIIWDNDGHSPASTFDQGKRRELYSNNSAQDHLTSLIRKISKDCKSSHEREANLFDVWMKKDDGERSSSSKPSDETFKKKSKALSCRTDIEENSKSAVQRIARKRSRVTSCIVKIKEELSNFIKDINENISDDVENAKDMTLADVKTESVQDACPKGNRARQERERSGQIEKLDGIFLLEAQQQQQQQQPVDMEIFEDGNWLDSEEFSKEMSGHKIGESDVIKNPMSGSSKRMVGICKEKVDMVQYGAGEVFVDSKCDRSRKTTEPGRGNGHDFAFGKKLVAEQPEGLREDVIIRERTADVQYESRTKRGRAKMVDSLSNSAVFFSEEHPAVTESMCAINEKGKHRPFAILCTDICKVGTEKKEFRHNEKQEVSAQQEERCNSKYKSGKFEQVTERLDVERGTSAIGEKGPENLNGNGKERLGTAAQEVKPTMRDLDQNEFSELLDKDDEFIFDEIDNGQNTKGVGNFDIVDNMVNECDLDERNFEKDLLLIEDAGNGDLKGLRCKNPINCTVDTEKRKLIEEKSKENFDDLLEVDIALDDIDFDDCADLIDDCRLIACGREQNLQGSVGYSENFVTNRTECKNVHNANQKGNGYGMNHGSMGNVVQSSSNNQTVRTSDGGKGSSRASRTAECHTREQNATENNLTAHCEDRDLIVNAKCNLQNAELKVGTLKKKAKAPIREARRKPMEFKDFENSNIDKCPDDYFADMCFNEQELSPAGFADDLSCHANKSKVNDIDCKLLAPDFDLDDWDDDIIVESDQLPNGRESKWGTEGRERQAAKILHSNTRNNCERKVTEKEEPAKHNARRDEGQMNLNWDVSRIQYSRSQRNEFCHQRNELILEQERSNFKSMPDQHAFRESDKINTNDLMNNSAARKEKKFGTASLTNKKADRSYELDGDNFWGDELFPLENASGPFTSTQKTNSAERVQFPRKEALLVNNTKTYSALEIERKKAEAVKRLEQKHM